MEQHCLTKKEIIEQLKTVKDDDKVFILTEKNKNLFTISDAQNSVRQFHIKHKFPVVLKLIRESKIDYIILWITYKLCFLISKILLWYWKYIKRNEIYYRTHLILEEFAEMIVAFNKNNKIDCADGLGDLLYVVLGFAVVYNLPAGQILKAICESNLTKKKRTKNNLRMRNKGKKFKPANVKQILEDYWEMKLC